MGRPVRPATKRRQWHLPTPCSSAARVLRRCLLHPGAPRGAFWRMHPARRPWRSGQSGMAAAAAKRRPSVHAPSPGSTNGQIPRINPSRAVRERRPGRRNLSGDGACGGPGRAWRNGQSSSGCSSASAAPTLPHTSTISAAGSSRGGRPPAVRGARRTRQPPMRSSVPAAARADYVYKLRQFRDQHARKTRCSRHAHVRIIVRGYRTCNSPSLHTSGNLNRAS